LSEDRHFRKPYSSKVQYAPFFLNIFHSLVL